MYFLLHQSTLGVPNLVIAIILTILFVAYRVCTYNLAETQRISSNHIANMQQISSILD